MSGVRPARRHCVVHRDVKGRSTLASLLDEFKHSHRQRIADETEAFASLSLDTVLEKTAMCKRADGKHHPHLNRISRRARRAAASAMAGVVTKLRKARDFNELFQCVSGVSASIRGLGDVWAYDTALAIGAVLGLKPEAIYLHAGTAKGARLFGVRGARWIPATWPIEFHASGMSADDLESFLCGYKSDLKKLKADGVLPRLSVGMP